MERAIAKRPLTPERYQEMMLEFQAASEPLLRVASKINAVTLHRMVFDKDKGVTIIRSDKWESQMEQIQKSLSIIYEAIISQYK